MKKSAQKIIGKPIIYDIYIRTNIFSMLSTPLKLVKKVVKAKG